MATQAQPGGGPGMAPNEGDDRQSIGIPGLSRARAELASGRRRHRPVPTGVVKSPNPFVDATANPAAPQVKAPESSPNSRAAMSKATSRKAVRTLRPNWV